MAKATELLNSNTKAVDVLVIGGTSYYKEGIVGRAGSLDHGIAAQRIGTHADDAALTVGTDAVVVMAGLADQTSPDSVDEGDVGALRMTLARLLLTASVADAAALTSVASLATSQTLLAANVNRVGAIIANDDANDLYVKFGATASLTSYTVKIASGASYALPWPVYRGVLDGIWSADGSGSARITELT